MYISDIQPAIGAIHFHILNTQGLEGPGEHPHGALRFPASTAMEPLKPIWGPMGLGLGSQELKGA